MSPVDDIIINKHMPQKRRGKSIILVLFFLLLIVLVGMCGAYYWYTNMRVSPREMFFKHIAQTNIAEIADTEIYYTILEKLNKENYETSTTANFTTNKKTDFTENVDVSKFEFVLDTKSDKTKEQSVVDANITYSSNDFLDLKFIGTKDNVAIGSNEVLDKYIATSKNKLSESINRTTTFETDLDADFADKEMDKFAHNQINFDEEFKTKKANEYMSLILEKVSEEAVTLTEASPITINSEVINTDAYTLTLSGQNYANLTKELLEKLRDDEELLNKITTGEGNELTEEPEETVQKPNPINIQPIGGETEEHQTTQIVGNEDLQVLNEPDTGELLESNEMMTIPPVEADTDIEETETEEEYDNILSQILGAILLNQKLDMTVEELQSKINRDYDTLISTDELKITVYVKNVEGEEKKTIKIVAELPQNADLDVEYPEQDKIKVTFLQDVEETDENGKKVNKNVGTSFEIKRNNTDMQTKFDITLNSIEEKKVIAKLKLDITTQGTKTSKKYLNDVIIKYNDNESDFKINLKNTIDFKTPTITEELNEENTIFVDTLSDEEATNLYSTIVMKLMDLYSEKIVNMNFIDNNSSSGLVEQPIREPENEGEAEPVEEETTEGGADLEEQPVENEAPVEETPINDNQPSEENGQEEPLPISKRDARDILISKIEEMMADAEEHEEEFSILNLELLPKELDGNKVEVEISEERAKVKVAEYTFFIDKDFMLTEE
ncbi:MAG: hypothetical protein OSJ66_04280 [Clostridia bacterium]|nr:hypothetical protein [Clostridia bacterium]